MKILSSFEKKLELILPKVRSWCVAQSLLAHFQHLRGCTVDKKFATVPNSRSKETDPKNAEETTRSQENDASLDLRKPKPKQQATTQGNGVAHRRECKETVQRAGEHPYLWSTENLAR